MGSYAVSVAKDTQSELGLNDERWTKGETWQAFKRYLKVSREVGGLVRKADAARMLGISPQAIDAAVKHGRLEVFEFPELKFAGVSGDQIKAYAAERIRNSGVSKGVAGSLSPA